MQGVTTPVKKPQIFQSPNSSDNGNTFDPEMSNIIDFPQLIHIGTNESQIYNSPQKKQNQITRSPSSGSKFNLSTSMGFTDRQINTERNLQSNEKQTKISLQPNISNVKRRLDFGDCQISVLQKEQLCQVQTPGGNSKSLSSPLNFSSPFDTPNIDVNLISKQQIGVENVPKKDKNFSKQCKYCLHSDDISFMVRPCLCKGSIQYVHQSCLQVDIEKNFMSDTKDRFTRDLACPLCKHPFLIKTYQTFSFSQLICDGNKKDFFYQNSKLIISTSFFIALIYFVSIFPQAQQFYTCNNY